MPTNIKYVPEPILLPTEQACWDYGIRRTAGADLSVISSFSPYKFLRGTQFDSKLFQATELVSAISALGSLFGDPAQSIVDEIVLEFIPEDETLGRPEYKVKNATKTDTGVPVPTVEPKENLTLGSELSNLASYPQLKIAPNWQDNIQVSHNHNWGQPSDIISQVIQQISSAVTNASLIGQTIKGSSGGRAFFDYVDRYQGTEKQSLTIPFTLFTRDNFARDILEPLMALTSLSYPHATLTGNNAKNMLGNAASNVTEKALNFDGLASDVYDLLEIKKKEAEKAAKEGGKSAKKLVETIIDFSSRAGARFFFGVPPSRFQVTHSSGIVMFKKAVIKNFSYNFKGPWVKKEYGGPGGLVGISQLDSQLSDVYLKYFSFPKHSGGSYTYPVQCECVLTIAETDQVYAEDWVNQLNRFNKKTGIRDKISSITSGPVGGSITAGLAQAAPAVLPSNRNQGGSSEWTPPGESISGIPGLL